MRSFKLRYSIPPSFALSSPVRFRKSELRPSVAWRDRASMSRASASCWESLDDETAELRRRARDVCSEPSTSAEEARLATRSRVRVSER